MKLFEIVQALFSLSALAMILLGLFRLKQYLKGHY